MREMEIEGWDGGNKFTLHHRVNITESSPAKGEETTMTKVFYL